MCVQCVAEEMLPAAWMQQLVVTCTVQWSCLCMYVCMCVHHVAKVKLRVTCGLDATACGDMYCAVPTNSGPFKSSHSKSLQVPKSITFM